MVPPLRFRPSVGVPFRSDHQAHQIGASTPCTLVSDRRLATLGCDGGVGATVEVTASFTDAGGNDTHTCSIDWGDGTVEPGVVANGDCTRSHAYGSVGVPNLTVTVTDDDGGLWITQACSASRFPTRVVTGPIAAEMTPPPAEPSPRAGSTLGRLSCRPGQHAHALTSGLPPTRWQFLTPGVTERHRLGRRRSLIDGQPDDLRLATGVLEEHKPGPCSSPQSQIAEVSHRRG